jgi:hypothetical protein
MRTGKTLNELAAEITRQNESKKDYIASTEVMKIAPKETSVDLVLGKMGEFPLSNIAHDQIAEHTGIPTKYYRKMREEAPELLKTNIEKWFAKYPAPRMVRTLDVGCRAFLSDRFQTFDNYDFAGAALPILSQRKLTVVSCDLTERKLYIKAIDEQLFRDVPVGYKMGDGSHRIFDTCAPVVILSNSEVGFGRLVIETGTYTRACTNLALFAKSGMKRTHVGARSKLVDGFGDDVRELEDVLTSETKRKTLEAVWMQARDVIASAFDKDTFGKRCEQLAVAAGHKITAKVEDVIELVQERFTLTEVERENVLKHLIEGGQLSQYGLHAAITRSAEDVESYDRATELEYAGGKILELPATEWRSLAEAA